MAQNDVQTPPDQISVKSQIVFLCQFFCQKFDREYPLACTARTVGRSHFAFFRPLKCPLLRPRFLRGGCAKNFEKKNLVLSGSQETVTKFW